MDAADVLKTTGNTHIVYAIIDGFWGIGVPALDTRCLDKRCWMGKNVLGEILSVVRARLYWSVVSKWFLSENFKKQLNSTTAANENVPSVVRLCWKRTGEGNTHLSFFSQTFHRCFYRHRLIHLNCRHCGQQRGRFHKCKAKKQQQQQQQ